MTIARWILAIPAAFLGWFLALFLGLLAHGFLTSLCPTDMMVSGACIASWHMKISSFLVPAFSGVAAILVIIFPTVVAPSYRLQVSVLAYVSGAIATFVLTQGQIIIETNVALGTGLLTVSAIWYLLRRHKA